MTQSIIITGATSGLGLELAFKLASSERHIVGVSRGVPNEARWNAIAQKTHASHVQGDVSRPETVQRAFAEAEAHGSLSAVINCAGTGVFGPAGGYARAAVDTVLAGNLIGLILFSEAGFQRLRTNGGDIVNVMSTAAHVARVNEAIYCASKWGARGYTEALRLEAKGTPVRIVAVYPGGMYTNFWRHAEGTTTDPSNFMDPSEVASMIVKTMDSQRTAYVSDIIINRAG